MKTVLLLLGLCAIALAAITPVKLEKQQQTLRQDTKEVLQFQKAVLRLFKNIFQPNYYSDQRKIGENYDIEANTAMYTNSQVVEEFMDLNRLGFLPKGEIFSIFYEQQRKEAVALFNVLYYAKDYSTFYKTACWARLFMNEGMFIYSLSVALVQRPDTAFIDLPPIYEMYPYYFYNMDVIQKARTERQMFKNVPESMFEDEEGQQPSFQKPYFEDQYPVEEEEEEEEEYAVQPQPRMLPQYQTLFPQQPWYMNIVPGRIQPNMYNQMPTPEQVRQEQLRLEQLRQFRMQQYYKQKLQKNQQEDYVQKREMIREKKMPGITILANYSSIYSNLNPEHMMTYFTEDVGLNSYYYYYNIYFPFWLSNDIINLSTERRGEQFYYMIQQLLARYYLERLSNGLGNIPALEYFIPIRPGYNPSLIYPNGLKFPERPNNLLVALQKMNQDLPIFDNYTNSYMYVRDYERRIRDAIDIGYVTTSTGKQIPLYDEQGLEILGNMIEGNVESPNVRFYGGLQILARYLLGNSRYPMEDHKILPSVLEQFETSLRDPVFYQFYKRMIMYFQRFMNYIPPYSTKELLMEGVKIQDVQVDSLITYFDYFYADISNVIYSPDPEESIQDIPIRVKQMRLNNKPFKYVLNVMSDKPYEAIIKVFLGPKYDETGHRLEMPENRLNFVEIDKFPVTLISGMNRVERSSRDSFFSQDCTSYRQLFMQVMTNMNKPDMMPDYEPREPEFGMPKRLLLPKGTPNGQMYQMYFIITPHRQTKEKQSQASTDTPIVNMRQVVDSYPLGYPLDRPIDESVFYVPNSYIEDVLIYNKELADIQRSEL